MIKKDSYPSTSSGRTDQKYLIFLLKLSLLFIFPPHMLNAVVVGSNTAVSREALTTFPSADNDNEMRGFASFEEGFKLENSATSCIFNSFFPLSGSMTLNGGTLNLSRDLIFEADFKNVGTITGNNYSLKSTSTAPIILPSGASGGSTLTFIDKEIFGKSVNSADWSYDDLYTGIGLPKQGGSDQEAQVYTFNGSSLSFKAADGLGLNIRSLRWRPTGYFFGFAAADKVGIYEFIPSGPSLNKTSDTSLNQDRARACGWDLAGNYIAVVADQSSGSDELYVYSVDGSGSLNFIDSINVGSNVTFSQNALEWDPTGNYIAVGIQQNGSLDELLVYSFNGSTLSLDASINVGYTVEGLSWSASGNFIAVGLSGSSTNIRVYSHSAGSLTFKTSVSESNTVNEVAWNSAVSYLAVGLVESPSTEVRVYSFYSSSLSLSLDVGIDLFGSINDIRWSHDDQYILCSDSNQEINIYKFKGGIQGDKVSFKNVKLIFNSDVTLKNNMQFQGDCAIKGNGHALDLDTAGNLIVTGGASLLLEDLTLKNVSGNNMRCFDSLSTVSLRDVTWLQEADYTFTVGRIDIIGDITITGTHTFTYQSNATSTIFSHAQLMFGSGMTFKYDPQTTDRDLLAMTDKTSVLHLCETTLVSTSTGLQLTKGTLVVEGTCPVESEATVEFEGITFGDGASASNDLTYKPLPESGLDIKSGFMVYKNVQG